MPETPMHTDRDAALGKIADVCGEELKRAILAGEVIIPQKKILPLSHLAPPMRPAQAESYATTGKALDLPRYRDVIDAALNMLNSLPEAHALTGVPPATTLAYVLNTRRQVGTPGEGVFDVPPLDTEKV